MAELSTAKRLGIEKGLLKGRQEGKLEIIKSMVRAGYSYDQVNEIYTISREEYDNLKANL